MARPPLGIREQQLGGEHPDTAQSLHNLARLYHAQGKNAEAEPLFRRALAIYEKPVGRDHPETQDIRKDCRVPKKVIVPGEGASFL